MSYHHPSLPQNSTADGVMDRLRYVTARLQSALLSAVAAVQRWSRLRVVARVLHLTRLTVRWIPLTPVGWASVLVLAWLLRDFGIARQDQVLLALSSTGLVVIALLMLVTLTAAIWLKLRNTNASPAAMHCESGSATLTGMSIPVLGYVPIVDLSIEWGRKSNDGPDDWQSVDAEIRLERNRDQLHERVIPARRGRVQEVVRRIRIGDVFSLTRIVFEQPGVADVTIRPRCSDAGRHALWNQFRAGDAVPDPDAPPEGDLIELRDYQPGDPLKRVCWKKYQRTGRLIVRAPERALEPCEQIAVTTVSAAADEPSAVLTRSLLEDGTISGRMIYCADGESRTTTDPVEAVAQLVRSAAATDVPGSGLDRLQEHPDVASCVIFVPHRPGPWLDAVATRIEKSESACRVIVGVNDGTPVDGPRWMRWIVSEPDGHASKRAELELIVRRLTAAGADVTVVDCLSGHDVPLPETN